MDFDIQFVIAPDHLLKLADEVLRSPIRCTAALRLTIRAVAKAYIDETDELRRGVRDVQAGVRPQIQSTSPPEVIAKAKSLELVALANKEIQEKVRQIAQSYVEIAEENQRLFAEFEERHRGQLPPKKE